MRIFRLSEYSLEELNAILNTLNGYISGEWFVFFLLGTGLFFTLYLKFPQFRFFRHAFRIVRGKYDKDGDEGDTSHFQALTTALSGTVGTGNIAGVALAIHVGGPAALFWMIITAVLGMTTKFVEVTLSHKYREKAEDGSIAGGPMYYMKNKLNMKWLAAIFAGATVLSAFGTGNLPQSNSIASSIEATFGLDPKLTGGLLAVLLGFVIIGGIKRIANVTEKLVPLMAVVYLIGAFAVIFFNIENVIPSIVAIFSDVFSGSAATGGFLGGSVALAFTRGVNRGLFSNEAGQGSAPIAHAAAKAHEPVSEGMVAILEPFIDTVLICTLTGITLLSSGVWNEKIENKFQKTDLIVLTQKYDETNAEDIQKLSIHLDGNEKQPVYTGNLNVREGIITNSVSLLHARSLAEDIKVFQEGNLFSGTLNVNAGKIKFPEKVTIRGKSLMHSSPLTTEAFKRSFLGDYGQYIISIGLLLFAFSTAIAWSYYGDRAITYLVGAKGVIYFRIVYVLGFFLAAFTDTTIIWTLSGITIALMTIPNLFGILLLRKDMKETVTKYWKDFDLEWGEAKELPIEKKKAEVE
ncbi:alanine/glycine:cation symporter family protein [Sediminitomix flava]|uniref:AGCS family alanine or glycine:cation symporter n=1 Tax=Sediminitomix flava TaxID=379075 RepID=A0A315ZEX6_SEDFL|nr:sodium:alanine symporter family protein [Sediminitomix flava]PWJ43882.1 AGCS family alanine or glycine:cation symporter [Sediminitomix flava]